MRSLRFLGLFSLSVCTALLGLGTARAEEPITVGTRTSIRSEILDEERPLMISLPAAYEDGRSRFPVLYLLDPSTRFHHTTATVRTLARIGHLPEMIVVGVVNTDRTRDLGPEWNRAEIEDDMRATVERAGGADRFLQFLADELIPHVESTYRTSPFRVLVGHSFGGLFAVHTLNQRPDLFQALLAISPSLWWDDGAIVDRARELLPERPELQSRLFVTIGDEGGDMLAQTQAFEEALRHLAPEGLSWEVRYLMDEDHGSVPVPSVHYGLRAFFPRWRVPPFVVEEGIAAVDRHYASLTADLGYPVAASENQINRLGYGALGIGEIEKALSFFQANVERFPKSANVYDSLGEAYEASGDLERARDLYRQAVDLAEQDDGAALDAFREHLAAIEEKLAGAD